MVAKTKAQFNPNEKAPKDAGIFGLPHTYEASQLVFVPVPWEATTSYGGGASRGPSAIFHASHQVDLFDLHVEKPYEAGLFMAPESSEIQAWSDEGKALVDRILSEDGSLTEEEITRSTARVNELSAMVNRTVEQETERVLAAGKIACVLGGDHASPLGALRALGKREKSFGILHVDAHSDTRDTYEGFTYSHASIMRNIADEVPQVTRIVQVGLRDVCEEEMSFTRSSERFRPHFDHAFQEAKMNGTPARVLLESIVRELPDRIWISFDIDGLDPRYCPDTGTPVPGGLDFAEAVMLVKLCVTQGKTILGFDLSEVSQPEGSPEELSATAAWNGNVGARLAYKLAAFTLASQGKAKLSGT